MYPEQSYIVLTGKVKGNSSLLYDEEEEQFSKHNDQYPLLNDYNGYKI